ncbi:hypothetical protein LTR56_027034 [Elasticomyces elasticus]|nr:hypothetical protein LTR56_027034 [Elasticomyces elasticus]KAK3616819.1 hypothetical protein LTR22_026947 [Elasticomyces elasticus]KAK5734628.1 hypothetical protein LTS12_026668 [Elasticomyces elasticus]
MPNRTGRIGKRTSAESLQVSNNFRWSVYTTLRTGLQGISGQRSDSDAMASDDGEDDYLSMAFGEPATPAKETSLQRTTRLKKEAAERGRVLSKKELAEQAKAKREAALATQLDSSNKGAKMMAKMGFKGGALGKTENARTQPIEILMKDDKGGIGMDSEKKRKLREAADEIEGQHKRKKVDEDEYRQRTRDEREERKAEGQMWSAMRTLESFDTDGVEGGEVKPHDPKAQPPPLHSVNILWRPLAKQRLEKERERRMRYDLDQSLAQRTDYEDPDADSDDKIALGTDVEELDEEDSELTDFEALKPAERLEKILDELRQKYHYCFWCKHRYSDEGMEDCPGLTEDEHG